MKRLIFKLIGKDPEAVIVHFACGADRDLCARMSAEVMKLEPARRHFIVTVGEPLQLKGAESIPLSPGNLNAQLRRKFRRYRVGLAPTMLAGGADPLRRAAFLFAPTRILAYNGRLERHHLKLSTWIASTLFLYGVPLDRIWLRPRWWPFRREASRPSMRYREIEGATPRPARKRIAIVSPHFPYPLSHGGAVRIYNLLKEAARSFDLYFFAFTESATQDDIQHMAKICTRIVLMEMPRYREPRWASLNPPEVCEFQSDALQLLLKEYRTKYALDLVQVEYTQLASYPGDILVEHDVTFDLYSQIHKQQQSISSWWNRKRWQWFERRAVRRFERVVVMSDKDRDLLGAPNAVTLPNGVNLTRFQSTPETVEPNILFVGSFRHFPNILAFQFFINEVWGRLSQRYPNLKFTVVAGADPWTYWRAFTDVPTPEQDPRVHIHEFVSDVAPLYAQATLVVVPTTVSAGTNLKVLEAMAAGRAIVSTPSGCAGLGLQHKETILMAETANEFHDRVCELLDNPTLRAAIALKARRRVELEYGWEAIGQKQREIWMRLLRGPIQIRTATPTDYETILRIQNASPQAAQWKPESYARYDFHVAEVDNVLAGFIVWRPTAPDEKEIINIAVDPNWRGRGIATELLNLAIESGNCELFLEVRESNSTAIRLYQTMGFVQSGLRPNYYENPTEHAIVMKRQKC